MAHNLERFGSDVAFATREIPAWHGLGQVFSGEVSTSEMLSLAHLNGWNVRLSSLTTSAPSAKPYFEVIRTNPATNADEVLAIVGDRYRILQNEELFQFGDAILDGGAQWETAGSIKKGTTVFGSLLINREFTLDPQGASDTTKTYLLVNSSHDGSCSVRASVTPVRVVCQNTLNLALRSVKQSFTIRHTTNLVQRASQARQALGLTFSYMDEFEHMATELFQSSMTNDQFKSVLDAVYPIDIHNAKQSVITKRDNKIDLIMALWLNSPTMENIKGTAWGALNAITERLDYFRDSRTSSNGTEGIQSAASGFEPAMNAEKARVLNIIRDKVGV
jgi:phage/plasmid-like protein (TIGR03299 family)